MKGLPFVLLFTAMTFIAWGAYGPVLHHGSLALNHDSLRAFVGVGLAYFLIAVIMPILILRRGKEPGRWTFMGAAYSLVAGAVGAIGALGIILALAYGGQTLYVMPLVFGFAPVVNTMVTAFLSRTFNQISPIFIGGIVAAALGAGAVLYFKPTSKPSPETNDAKPQVESLDTTVEGSAPEHLAPANPPLEQTPAAEVEILESEERPPVPPAEVGAEPVAPDSAEQPAAKPSDEQAGLSQPAVHQDDNALLGGKLISLNAATIQEESESEVSQPAQTDKHSSGSVGASSTKKYLPIALSIIVAALCWGSYGPMLHIGQQKMDGSRLRPFICVGLAYFFIAVAAPLALIYLRPEDSGAWTTSGMSWSFLAGVAGAIGALGVILAFNAGGKPYYVMPLIFGFAPVINTFISLSETNSWGRVSPPFWIGLAVVIAGAVTVLTNAPKPKHK